MSSEWRSYRLDEAGLIVTGKTPKGNVAEYVGRDVPFVTPPDFDGSKWIDETARRISKAGALSVKSSIVPAGSVLVTCIGSDMGKAALTRSSCVTNQQINAVVVDENRFCPEFLYYNLSLRKDEIRGLAGGSAQPILNKSAFGQVRFDCPPLLQQKAIAAAVGPLDNRITLLRETNATLEAIAQALFKSWFVDFDPVHARARGEEPAGLAPEIAALFPDSFEESEVGLVPKGWKFMPFGELLSHTIGGDWGDEAPNDKNDTQVAIIRGTDMPGLQSGMIGRVPVRYTSQKKLASRKLQDGDLVLEVSGGSKDQPTGRSLYMTNGLLDQFNCPVEPASFCRLLRPASHDLGVLLSQHMTYIYADGKTWQYQNQSTGIANFQTTHFLETELVAVPTDDVLKSFAEIVRSMIDRSHLTQIAQLATLRDTLLPRLISGQLRLPEAEAMFREAQK
ncbi:restriction endonuclease subunit S [Aeromonas caviae]|uniref:restriction endonuclease subunit S n=1 Tax=Aeromonas caviae TaxID=648 RepID=UPI00191D145D|nr:restriction endonuclease subunit S [Aeromonas caviae]MBL0653002.1 restriction endonuclease subunit S [Aeromonas caviae]